MKRILIFILTASTAFAQTKTLTVNGGTGAITAPVSVSAFRSANSLVGLSDSQTLTNKTISGSSNTLSDISASALAATLDLSGKTITLPSLSGTTNITGANLSAQFLEEAPTNAATVPDAVKELVIKAGGGASNVLSLRHPLTTGYAAFTGRDYLGNERFATGYGNPGSYSIFADTSFIQTWHESAVPPLYQITADGDYGQTGSGFRFYRRLSLDWDAAGSFAQFNVWHHIPWGTTQRVAFQVECKGNIQSRAKVQLSSTDLGYQLWKDATPSKAVSWGMCVPGNAPGDDQVLSAYDGSSWQESLRIETATRRAKFSGVVQLKAYTVATLPAGSEGDIAYVTDATSPTYLGTLTGGGSVKVPVFYNGSAWVSY